MTDAPLASDDRQDQLLRQEEEAAEGNGNGNNGDSRSRTRFDYDASAGDDDGCSFGSGGTGSEAAEEDRGLDAGTDLDVGRMTLARGDQQPAATTVAVTTASALAAMTLTGNATAAAGKTKIEPDAEAEDDEDDAEAPPAAISKIGTATITNGSKAVLRQGKQKLEMPLEVLAGISKFLPYGEGAAGANRSIAGVVTDCLDSNDWEAFLKAFMNSNFFSKSTPMRSFELQLFDFVLHHEVCDVNVLSNEEETTLHSALYELWNLGPDDSQNRFSRCLATIAMLVKAGADIDREAGADADRITPQEIAIEMTESDDEEDVARGVLALEVLNGRLLMNEDIPGIIAKSNAFASVLSFF